MQLSGRHAAREDSGSLTAATGDTAGAGPRPVATATAAAAGAAAASADDTAERWPADSGADPWTARPAAVPWARSDAATGWAGNGASATAEGANGRNGFNGLPGYGDEGGWPTAGDPVHADTPEHHDPDDDDADFADSDSLPRRVRQASLAPQLRENTLYGQPGANGDTTAAPGTVEERSPEEARSTITAIQQGWERGRSLFDPPEKTTDTMAGTQSPEESPPEAGEAGRQGDE